MSNTAFVPPKDLADAIQRGYIVVARGQDERLYWSKVPVSLGGAYYAASVLSCGFVVPSMVQEMIAEARTSGVEECEMTE